jgi:SAM-dependent methyltransferase
VTLPNGIEPGHWQRRASSFGTAADLYDRVRPTYPVAAVEWALEPLGPARAGTGRWRIADVGAGTGIMTRVLVALGQSVVAVEPDEQMRGRLMAITPDVEAVPGSAENLPFADGDLDAVVAAQAYHWFDHDRAQAELARALRPGGVLVAIWNDRDESVGWVAEYSRILGGGRKVDRSSITLEFGELFHPTETGVFRHEVNNTAASIEAQLQSYSSFLTADPAAQAQLTSKVRELTRTHPDLAGRTEFPLPYVTRVFRAVRI